VNWDWSGNPDPAAMRQQLADMLAGVGMAPREVADPPPAAPSEPGWDWSGDPDHAAMMARLTGEQPAVAELATGVELLDVGQPATQPTVPGWDWSGDPDHAAMFAALTDLLNTAGLTRPVLTLVPSGYLIVQGPGLANAGVAAASAQALQPTVTSSGGAHPVSAAPAVAQADAPDAVTSAAAGAVYASTYTATYPGGTRAGVAAASAQAPAPTTGLTGILDEASAAVLDEASAVILNEA
jgi:hypothetical protein